MSVRTQKVSPPSHASLRSVGLVAAVASLFISTASCARPARSAAPAPLSSVREETASICRADSVPAGWVRTDDRLDMHLCQDAPHRQESIYNVWIIQRYDHLPVGYSLVICASERVPEGWAAVGQSVNAWTCGRPGLQAKTTVPNTRTIQRVR
jgi:hypothetical protein